MDLQLPVQSVQPVPITTRVASSNSGQGEVSSIQHYVIKLVSVRFVVFSEYIMSFHIIFWKNLFAFLVKDVHSKT
jgi:hypothetical protein